MKCIIPGANIKLFGRAIHSLSKIGEELYVEPMEHGLALRTVNSSRSAYACFVFAPTFFIHYDDQAGQTNTDAAPSSEEDVLKCKIGMKSCLTVFKSLSSLEKTVDKCKVTLNMDEARLVFQLHCRHGIVKTYNLSFIECETLQAVFSKDLTPNVLTAQTKLLCETVVIFQTNQEEISLAVNPERVCFKNYVEDESDPQKVIRTQMNLDPEEFENYQVGVDTEVTFCLKEFRAILGFSEPNNLPLSMHFESAGKPMVLCIDCDPSFEAHFVLATLADPSSQASCSQQPMQQSRVTSKTTTCNNTSKSKATTSLGNRRTSREGSNGSTNATSDPYCFPSSRESADPKPDRRAKKKVSDRMAATLNTLMEDISNDATVDVADNTTATVDPSNHGDRCIRKENVRWPQRSTCSEGSASPVIPVQNAPQFERVPEPGKDKSGYLEQPEEEMEDEGAVPGTPPKKKFKSVFFGLSQASLTASQHQQQHGSPIPAVLAAETDDEDED